MFGQVFSVSHSYRFNVKCADGRYDLILVYVDTVFFFVLHIFFVSFFLRHTSYELFLNSIFLHVPSASFSQGISVLAVSFKNFCLFILFLFHTDNFSPSNIHC